MIRVKRVLTIFSSIFSRAGFQCFLVGGAVRDMLLGIKAGDFDIATDARPEDVQSMFRRVIPTGIAHGTVTVLFKGTTFEVTTFRLESEYRDGRRPESVSFTPSILQDLNRRDFTINAIAYDLAGGALLDPHRGREDLKKGIIRAIGNPNDRFSEDGLRPVRACRFAAQFNFKIEANTLAAMRRALGTVKKVSAERIRDELVRMLAAEAPSIGFKLMSQSGLLELILPELEGCARVSRPELHCSDLFDHLLVSCDAAPRDNLVVRLAALLHDIGKPLTLKQDREGRLQFYGHEEQSAVMSEAITRRLRFSNQIIKRVAHLIRQHMFNYCGEWSDAAVRRFIARVGEHSIADLLSLRRADQIGYCGARAPSQSLLAFEDRLKALMAAERSFSLEDLAVNGNDIMSALSIPPGPQVGIILKSLLESVLDDPNQNQRSILLDIARGFYEAHLKTDDI